MSHRRRLVVGLIVMVAGGAIACGRPARSVIIGSKDFTEQLILGELLAQHIEHTTSLRVERHFYLAGTFICQQAMMAGRIDSYIEYTGTGWMAVLKKPLVSDRTEIFQQLQQEYARRFQFAAGPPLGFSNSFAVVMRSEDARRLHIKTMSELSRYSEHLRLGVGYEFQDRVDGLRGLERTYALRFATAPQVMDLGLIYRALEQRRVDVVVGSSTDGLIAAWHLSVLEDDRHYFPPYDAVPITRGEILRQYPELRRSLGQLAGKIDLASMRGMNYAVDAERESTASVVSRFRAQHGL